MEIGMVRFFGAGVGWAIAACVGFVLLFTLLVAFLNAFRLKDRSAAFVRLDWFLPFWRKRKHKDEEMDSFIGRFLRRVLPLALFSDRTYGKVGLTRRVLRWLGPTVVSSPLRRAVQAACLGLFLYLFFYVCWPYTTHLPRPGGRATGWRFQEMDSSSGEVRFVGESKLGWDPVLGNELYLQEERSPGPIAQPPLPLILSASEDGQISVRPGSAWNQADLERLLGGAGEWTIYEKEPPGWPSQYADELQRKEFVPADIFLVLDPLVSMSTALASRNWVWSLACAVVILLACALVPRGFCGYLCPLGSVIDFFDWAIVGRTNRYHVPANGWWVHVKYYLLGATLIAALCGVLVSGYVSAIPVITRALFFIGEPLQSGFLRGWHLVPGRNAGHLVSIFLFLVVLGLGLLRPRFWCKYVCPTGAVFSITNLFRLSERKVESSCIQCNKCIEICPFDAIKPDFTTRVTDCTLCQSCGGVCPSHSIKFVERWNRVELKVENDPPTGETPLGRRGFVSLLAGTTAAMAGGLGAAGTMKFFGQRQGDSGPVHPVRPPGSVPEAQFLQMCIRCGECFKACPNNVLQAQAFQQGLEGLWTPAVNANWAGCESSCNACGQVCPTGAIRALPLEEKKAARMGLAVVNEKTCLPLAGREACQLCVDECVAAGYHAIDFQRVHAELNDDGSPEEGSGFLAPVVSPELCVGCGLCQTRCHTINVKAKKKLSHTAIEVFAGPGKEDRLMKGSYLELREQEKQRREEAARKQQKMEGADSYLPEFLEE